MASEDMPTVNSIHALNSDTWLILQKNTWVTLDCRFDKGMKEHGHKDCRAF